MNCKSLGTQILSLYQVLGTDPVYPDLFDKSSGYPAAIWRYICEDYNLFRRLIQTINWDDHLHFKKLWFMQNENAKCKEKPSFEEKTRFLSNG